MIILPKALSAWGDTDFKVNLKAEIETLAIAELPLQQGMSQSSYVSGDNFSTMIIDVVEVAGFIRIKAGIFYSGVIAGCNCADDLSPIDEQPEYCEVEFEIDKATAETRVRLLSS